MPVGGDSFRKSIELLVKADTSALQQFKDGLSENERVLKSYVDATAKGAITTAEFQANTKGLLQEQVKLAEAIKIGERAIAAQAQAELDSAVAARQRANAAAGVAREQGHLNDLLHEGARLERDAAKATAEVGTAATAAGKTLGKGGSFGTAILYVSQGVDDIQYGFRGIVNNIAPLVLSLGGGAGLAGVLTVVAVGANQALARLSALGEADLSKSIGAVEDLKAKIANLEAKKRVGLDFSDLDSAKVKLDELLTKQSAFNAISGRTNLQAKAGTIVTEGIVEGGGKEAVVQAVADIEKSQGTFLARSKHYEAIREALENARLLEESVDAGQVTGDEVVGVLGRVQSERDKAAGLTAQAEAEALENIRTKLVGGAASGVDEDRARLLQLFNENRGAFAARGVTDRFGFALVGASPEFIRADEQNQREAESQGQQSRLDQALKAKGDRAKDDEAKRVEKLLAEGRQHDRILDDLVESEGKGRKKADDETAKRVRQAAGDLGPGFDDALQRSFLGGLAGGKSPDAIAAGLQGQLAGRLKGRVPDDIVDAVAAEILDRSATKVQQQLDQQGGAPGQAAAGILQQQQAKADKAGARGVPTQYLGSIVQAGLQGVSREQALPIVARDLAASGLDPSNANSVIEEALRQFNQRHAAALLQTGNAQRALAQALGEMGGQVAAIAAAHQQLAGAVDHQRRDNYALFQRLRTQRRTLLRTPGF